MDCDQALSYLLAHMDHELERAERSQLDGHLQCCASCRALADSYRVQDADLRRAFAPRRRAAVAVANRVIAQLPVRASRNGRRLPWIPMLLSAAAGFLLAILILRPWAIGKDPLIAKESEPPSKHIVKDEQSPQPEPEGMILAVADRAVEMLAPGNTTWEALRVGGKVALGGRIRTDASTRCEFHAPDGSQVLVNGETQLRFAGSRQVEMDSGQILARVLENTTPFQVTIPAAVITALATEFDILCQPAQSVVTVVHGSTRIESKQSKAVILKSRERARIVNGVLTEHGPTGDLNRTIFWTNQLLILKGDQQELSRRIEDLLAQLGNMKMDPVVSDSDIRALGEHCVRPLLSFTKSDRSKGPGDLSRRHRAARLIGDLAPSWSIPNLISLLTDDDGEVRYQAARALTRLTEQDQGSRPDTWRYKPRTQIDEQVKRWQGWWEQNKSRFPTMPSDFPVLTQAPRSTKK